MNAKKHGRRPALPLLLALASLALAGCGGGGGSSGGSTPPVAAGPTPAPAPTPAPSQPDLPESRAQAARFLNQATMGAKAADIDHLMAVGYSAWLDEQFAAPSQSYLDYWNARQASQAALGLNAGTRETIDPFYIQAATAPDQLRQRVALALSEIMVISTADSGVANIPQAAAAYVDMLHQRAFGDYRQLLRSATLSPAMGTYLTSIHNLKEDPASGREPDQNYARESMQLFSIGLYALNPDGTLAPGPSPTYGPDDILGLSKVFTGWSWAGPDLTAARFFGYGSAQDPARFTTDMQPYSQYHSPSAKRFLGQSIAASSGAGAAAELDSAISAMASHPNRSPFIAKQMIQRMVSSNPSPAYVARAAAAFSGGDMKALIRAVLLDPEARSQLPGSSASSSFGKVKEPILRLTQFLRATGAASDSGLWLVGATDDPSSQLGQSFLRSPSVFNFFRPGYVKPLSATAALGLVAPELQILDSNTAAGYANYMLSGIQNGFGMRGADNAAARRDVQIDWSPWLDSAKDPQALAAKVEAELFADGSMTPELRALIVDAISSVPIPADAAGAAKALLSRAELAHFLAAASPEFIVAQ